jgi:hypothetical protein
MREKGLLHGLQKLVLGMRAITFIFMGEFSLLQVYTEARYKYETQPYGLILLRITV